MKLTKVSIHKYKSFLTEQTYEVESQITRIVGKNESGKTALLEALAKSNYFEDNADFQFDKDLDYGQFQDLHQFHLGQEAAGNAP